MLEQIFSKYPVERTSLVMILQDVQSEFGYLPTDALNEVSVRLQIPAAQVYSVATFYNVLSLVPRGRNLVRVCMGTACHVRQAPLILEAVKRELNIEPGSTTENREFTFQSVGCVGACALGPVVEVNDMHHGYMNVNKMNKLLKKLEQSTKDEGQS
jgi:NADH-quinone oxidoreductase subunit E